MHETASPSKHTSLKREPKVMSAETPPVLFQGEMNVKKRITLISTIAVFFMLIALPCLVMLLLFERIVDTKISESIKLQNGSAAFKSWKTKSSPSKFAVYLYNLTNPDQVLAGERPNLTVIGPYVYWKEVRKLNISWTSVDGTPAISYLKRSIYIFDPILSSGNPKLDKIISANLPILAISAANNAGRGPSSGTIEMIKFFSSPKIFTRQSVDGFLWGYEDTTLCLCRMFFPEICPIDRVGLLSNSNNTMKGPYVIDSGINNSTNTGSFITIKGSRSLNIWSTEKANAIHGTDGFRLARNIQLSDSREIFVTLLCQPITLNATKISRPKAFTELEVVEMELDTDSRTLKETYCPLKVSGPPCPPKGYYDISQCSVPGDVSPPVFASLPRFMDKPIDNAFIVREVDQTRDKFRLLAEPKTGIVVEAHVRLLVNVHIQRSPHMTDLFMNISDPMYLPMAWFENDIEGSSKDLKQLHDALYRIYCCLCLTRQNPSVQSLLLDPPADSAVDLFTKNSDTMSSKISPWSNSVHSKSENQDGSETNSL
ncbi:unnamed protein product [Hymenolepis diminuta]|uniref:Uncharacterized protein n=1 Tax=Hymenolepis diminuta TaxID=6216 RepID=A0A564Y9V2_HYMDI|nr:unnamed protein product [Hymenolepis diminuta]